MNDYKLKIALGDAISGLDSAGYEARQLGQTTLADELDVIFDRLDKLERRLDTY